MKTQFSSFKPGPGMLCDRKAFSAAFGLLATLVLVLIAGGLVDIYNLYTARTWAYSVAQEAALAGASRGRDWQAISTNNLIQLDESTTRAAAQNVVSAAMQVRGISTFTSQIEVLPDPFGGNVLGFPPDDVRLLENASGDWSSSEPAVGVYLEIPVDWMLLDLFGISFKTVSVFASAGVVQ